LKTILNSSQNLKEILCSWSVGHLNNENLDRSSGDSAGDMVRLRGMVATDLELH